MNDAIARHQKMVEQFPDNELARFSLGKALYDVREYAQAVEHLACALAKKPDWMAVEILIGRCELALGNKETAKKALTHARQLAVQQNHDGPLKETELLLQQIA